MQSGSGVKVPEYDLRIGKVAISAITDTPAYIIGYQKIKGSNDGILMLSSGEQISPMDVTARPLTKDEIQSLLRVKFILEILLKKRKEPKTT